MINATWVQENVLQGMEIIVIQMSGGQVLICKFQLHHINEASVVFVQIRFSI